ncbi:MAG: T9SS type A sorting domain-containing protein [Bacteroidetes bacterium]|jgi:lysyl endopeptidase|nr:T9SS type A sorting domain-containing protein [Bacteroidota bacterium]MBT6687519.1 T9SS type A sorting domain-containing protein [Bacteroidota bacterium]MBT7143329.1 T9SS type A sorting domain-containing protein [Bacteroidota bacterium]
MRSFAGSFAMLFLLLFIFQNSNSFAQKSKGGSPISFYKNLNNDIPIYEMENIDIQSLKNEDLQNAKKNIPMRYAATILFEADVLKKGKSDILENGDEVWRCAIRSRGAYSIGLKFKEFHLPEGSKLFIYSADGRNIAGAFTAQNNKISRTLTIAPVKGEEIVIEYHKPRNAIGLAALKVGEVYHDYINVYAHLDGNKDGSFGNSGSCNVDINCTEGDDWQNEKHAVCRIIINSMLCSGALVNNTNSDGSPYVLTAHHCITNGTNAADAIFYFNYESPTCSGPDGEISQQISSSTLKATHNNLDFSLVELSISPPANYLPYYAGWDRQTESPKKAICLHHPQGDVKKISKDYDSPTTGDYGAGLDQNTHWWIHDWELGTTEGGSSGSPLFNEEHRIIGELTGGQASCSNNVNDYFQKINAAWDSYPLDHEQLQTWLDPNNSGDIYINGYNPFHGSNPPIADFSSTYSQIVEGGHIDFTDLSSGNPTSWSWSFSGANTTSSSNQHPVNIVYETPGVYNVKLIATNSSGNDEVLKSGYVTVVSGCDYVSNIADTEELAAYGFGTSVWGWWTGHNEYEFTEFAEKYSNQQANFIHGVDIAVASAYAAAGASKITVKVWEGGNLPGSVLHSKDILISGFQELTYNYIDFDPAIETDGNFFIGYEIFYNNPIDTFVVFHADLRGEGGLNTSYVKENGVWKSFVEISSGFTTSLSLEPFLCGTLNSIDEKFNSENINIYPNPASSLVYVDMDNDLLSHYKIRIFNMLGEIINNISISDSSEKLKVLNFEKVQNGLYLIIIENENYRYSKKILIEK